MQIEMERELESLYSARCSDYVGVEFILFVAVNRVHLAGVGRTGALLALSSQQCAALAANDPISSESGHSWSQTAQATCFDRGK